MSVFDTSSVVNSICIFKCLVIQSLLMILKQVLYETCLCFPMVLSFKGKKRGVLLTLDSIRVNLFVLYLFNAHLETLAMDRGTTWESIWAPHWSRQRCRSVWVISLVQPPSWICSNLFWVQFIPIHYKLIFHHDFSEIWHLVL